MLALSRALTRCRSYRLESFWRQQILAKPTIWPSAKFNARGTRRVLRIFIVAKPTLKRTQKRFCVLFLPRSTIGSVLIFHWIEQIDGI